jgi:hypothetical protein
MGAASAGLLDLVNARIDSITEAQRQLVKSVATAGGGRARCSAMPYS